MYHLDAMSATTADEGLVALMSARAELVAWQEGELSEADTRAKIVDKLLKDVFGWQEKEITRESRTDDGQYADYILESRKNRFIVEAKRTGKYFNIPVGVSLRAKREGILTRAPDLHDALSQLVDYCKSKSVPVGVASNGLQLAVTMVYAPAQSGGYDTLVFDGFESISKRVILLWNLLSPTGTCEEELRKFLTTREFIRPAPSRIGRLLDQLPLPDESMERNPAVVSLSPVVTRFFSELTGEGREDMLRIAYVESERQAQYGRQIDALLADHVPLLGPKLKDVTPQKRKAPEVDQAFRASQSEGRVIPLVGGVGAGKTTFEHRYFTHLIGNDLKTTVMPVFLDFRRVGEESDLASFVDEAVQEQLEQWPDLDLGSWAALQQVYRHEITKLREGVLAPYWKGNRQVFQEKIADELEKRMSVRETHIERVLDYLRANRGVEICVVFDNVDQFSQEIQHSAIHLAYQRCRLWRCFGILALREETYWRLRNTSPLDAFHRYAYHIAAPRIANVLSRRLEVATDEAGDEPLEMRTATGATISGVSVGEFLDTIVASFLGKDQRNILLLESLSANDVRQALDMFETFLLSGHTNTEEYIKTMIASGSYNVPFHSVVRSIALGERRYYDSSRSLIANLFSVEDDGFFSHFQKIRLLRYLTSIRQMDAAPARGFMPVERMYDVFRGLISDEEGLRRLLDPLLRNRLVESANGYRVTGEKADLVRVTSAGAYYVNTLVHEFTYLDLVSTDTPIKSADRFANLTAKALRRGAMRDAIGDRLKKVEEFLNYLVEEEDEEAPYVAGAGLPADVASDVMPGIVMTFDKEAPEILRRAKKYGREIERGAKRSSSDAG